MNDIALVLLSGGLDSTTTLAIANNEGYDIIALSFDYSQKHHHELKKAKESADHFKIKKHIIYKLDSSIFSGSSLTSDLKIPENESVDDLDFNEIPNTYVPARNIIFLSIALALAESENASTIFIGVNALDYSGYPDCRPEFIDSFKKMAKLGTKAFSSNQKLEIKTPLIHLTKSEIIQKAKQLNLDFKLTSSCYQPDLNGHPCGRCDSCLLRKKGFQEAGIYDPLKYRS